MIKSAKREARQAIQKYIIEDIRAYIESFPEYDTLIEYSDKDLLIFFLEDYYARNYNDVTIPRYYKTYFDRFTVYIKNGSCPFWEYPTQQFNLIKQWLQYTPEETENNRKQYGVDKVENYFYKLLYREFTFLCNKNGVSIAEYFRAKGEI